MNQSLILSLIAVVVSIATAIYTFLNLRIIRKQTKRNTFETNKFRPYG